MRILLAINIGVKILGPVFGFVLGSLCTSIYVDPLVDPDVTPKDPRWIGAWWLGNHSCPEKAPSSEIIIAFSG